MKRVSSIILTLAALCMPAHAACPERIVITGGDTTVAALARACGVNAEALKAANPGMTGATITMGTRVRVPRAAISMPSFEIGRQQTRITSPSVPYAPGPSGSTVILPPAPLPIPRQHVLPGFGDQPGQLPLPPGHTPPAFGKPFLLHQN